MLCLYSYTDICTGCPTLPISAGSSRFCLRSPASRLDRRWDNSDPACPQALLHCYLIVQYRHTAYECPAIGVLEYTCSTMAAMMNYNGRGDVSSVCANAALGTIINVTRTYVCIFSATHRKAARAFFRCAVAEIKVVNHASKACS